MASVNSLLCFAGPNAEPNSIGLKAVERARLAGFTDQEIRDMAREEGITVGEKAREALQLN